jgi:hypothetical protein
MTRKAGDESAMIDDTVLHAGEMGIAKQVVELVTVDRTVDEVRERAIVSNQILLAIGPSPPPQRCSITWPSTRISGS